MAFTWLAWMVKSKFIFKSVHVSSDKLGQVRRIKIKNIRNLPLIGRPYQDRLCRDLPCLNLWFRFDFNFSVHRPNCSIFPLQYTQILDFFDLYLAVGSKTGALVHFALIEDGILFPKVGISGEFFSEWICEWHWLLTCFMGLRLLLSNGALLGTQARYQ